MCYQLNSGHVQSWAVDTDDLEKGARSASFKERGVLYILVE